MTYRPTAVYLMRNEWAESNFKIGVSNNPFRRHYEVEDQYLNVYPTILGTCWFPQQDQARKAEHIWHQRHSEKRTDDHGGREWFSLSERDISEFLQWTSKSKTDSELKDWLFRLGASLDAVNSYRRQLINAIPKRRSSQSIETWYSPTYFNLQTA